MRKYIFVTCLLAIMAITFTAYATTNGGILRPTEPELAHDISAHQEAVTQAACWQDAYMEKLHIYTRLPVGVTGSIGAEWRFILHDIDQDGVPELFIVVYYDGFVDNHTVYSFEDGNAVLLKSALSMGSLFRGGIYIAPGGTGVIRYINTGAVSHYLRLELFGVSLSRSVYGDAVPLVDSFRVNALSVTEDEFEYIFGCPDKRTWLVLHEITEANIKDIIFGWQQ